MNTNIVKFYYLTPTQFNGIENKNDNYLYFVSNSETFGSLYRGAQLIADQTDVVTLANSLGVALEGLKELQDLTSSQQTAINNIINGTTIVGNATNAVTAQSAAKLGNTSVGAAEKPVYFNGGVPVACSHTILTDVPANAIFTDTKYSGANGISLSGTTFSNSGVRSVSSGGVNGTISVNTNGSSANVAVTGLKEGAFLDVNTSSEAAPTTNKDSLLPSYGRVEGLIENAKTTLNNSIANLENNKVDKVSGKGLSTNDYTTAEKNKLGNIAAGAEVNQNAFSTIRLNNSDSNKISADSKTDTLDFISGNHTTPSISNGAVKIDVSIPSPTASTLGGIKTGGDITITDGVVTVNDDSHAHIIGNVDGLQGELDGKVPTTRTVNGKALSSNISLTAANVGADASGSAATALTNAKSYTDTSIANLVDGSPDLLNTLNEIAEALRDNPDIVTFLEDAIGKKLDTSTFNTFKTDTVEAHINNTNNPHVVTKSQVGLSNVGNFKAVSTVASQGLSSAEQTNAKNNIGLGAVNNTADSAKSVAYAGVAGKLGSNTSSLTSAGNASVPVYFSNGVPTQCTSLSLNTSGSSASCTGNAATATSATTASKLSTNAGNTTTPIYFANGVPTVCSYTLAKSVPSNAVFTDTTYTLSSITGTLALNKGGTGATTAENARTNLDVYSKQEVNDKLDGLEVENVVELSGEQTITGVKTFTNGLVIGDAVLTYDTTEAALKITFN